MDLLIAILMYLGVWATPDQLADQDFINKNQASIQTAQTAIDQGNYGYDERGGIVITDGTGNRNGIVITDGTGNRH
jgi:hypothetical protein